MDQMERQIPERTIATFARSFFREASSYGFEQIDYVRFVNLLLDISIETRNTQKPQILSKIEPVNNSNHHILNKPATQLPLRGQRLSIRAFDKDQDLKLFRKWLCDTRGRYFLLSRTTAKAADFDKLIASKSNIVGVITLHDGTPIGSLAFLNFDPIQKKAELRKLIGEVTMRGKGFAKEATRLWIQYGITSLRLNKIYLSTFDTDIRNIRLNEELGFRVEGILRNEVLFDGVYHDVLRMSLLNEQRCHR